MVTRNGHYRSPEKGYSRRDAQERASRIVEEELYGEAFPEHLDDRGVAPLIFDNHHSEPATNGADQAVAEHDREGAEPIDVDPPEIGEARRAIRAMVTRSMDTPAPSAPERPAPWWRRGWDRLRALFR